MKKGLTYLLLFAYAIVVVKPVLPSVTDIMAHVFWYSKHMATVHYEHGRYHVHLEYAESAKKGNPEKSNTIKEDESLNMHVLPGQNCTFTPGIFAEHIYFSRASLLPIAYGSCNYPPPKTGRPYHFLSGTLV